MSVAHVARNFLQCHELSVEALEGLTDEELILSLTKGYDSKVCWR